MDGWLNEWMLPGWLCLSVSLLPPEIHPHVGTGESAGGEKARLLLIRSILISELFLQCCNDGYDTSMEKDIVISLL